MAVMAFSKRLHRPPPRHAGDQHWNFINYSNFFRFDALHTSCPLPLTSKSFSSPAQFQVLHVKIGTRDSPPAITHSDSRTAPLPKQTTQLHSKSPTAMDAPVSRSSSRPRPSSRPTTPLRPSSRSSLREAHGYGHSISQAGYNQPAINALEPQFAELADSMADLEANFMHLQLMHESLTRFSESFASFLYGMNMNAFCVDFPEVCPYAPETRRAKRVLDERCSPLLGSDYRLVQESQAG
jgi:DASH complex subunit DAM1